MKKLLAILLLFSMASCVAPPSSIPPTPSPTIDITPTQPPSPTVRATLSPAWTSTPAPTPVVEDDLAPYRLAMRPAFAGDVDRFAGATRYWIDLEARPDELALSGTARVRYTNQEDEPLREVLFRLLPNTPGYGGVMAVSRVTIEGAPADTELTQGNSTLTVHLNAPLPPGGTVEIELVYQGDLPASPQEGYAQYGLFDGVLALPNAYPLIPAYDDEGWNAEVAPTYGDATFSDTALYVVRITLPTAMVAAASGVLVAQETHSDGTTTTTYATGPMRDFCVVASADYAILSAQVNEVTVRSIYLQGNRDGGERALDYAVEALRTYEPLFGPYPFGELDVVATPTLAGGIEYPGLVVIAANLYTQQGSFFELVAVHEVAHQWWYSLVGNDQVDEPWLDEALSQYTSLLYYEQRYGPERARQFLQSTFLGPYQDLLDNGRDMPAGLPVRACPAELYGPVVYGKGPLYFHELRSEVGDQIWIRILQTYYQEHLYGVAYPDDWLAAVKEVAGEPFEALYRTWISGE